MKLSLILSSALILTFSSNGIQSLENVGCLFSDDLCDELEVCLDDNAFGRCERVEDLNDPQIAITYQHLLNAKTLKLLENEMQRLYISGYRWDNDYTQCVIKQILYTHRLGIDYDPGLCSRLLKLYSPHIAPETEIDLNAKSLPNPLADIEFIPDYESDFAKEVFSRLNDKNKYNFKTKKRDENKVEIDSKVFTFLKKLIEEQLENDDKYSNLVELPDHKISLLETDLSSDLTQKPLYSEAGVQWLPIDSDNSDGISAADTKSSDLLKSILESESLLSDGGSDTDSAEQPIFLQPVNRDSSDDQTSDAVDYENNFWNALEDVQNYDQIDDNGLIGGRSFPRQHRYDTKKPGPGYYIHETDSQEVNPKQLELSNGLDLDWDQQNEPSDELMANWSKSDESELEDLIEQQQLLYKNGGQKEKIHFKDRPLSYLLEKKTSRSKAFKPVSEGPVKVEGESKDDRVIVPAEDGESTQLEAIDTSYAFVVVDKPFGEEDGSVDKFVTSLEQLLLVPKGTFSNVRPDKENSAQLSFKVNPNRMELNASLVAQQIEDLTVQVKNRTGYEILKAGIGYKTKLEVLSNRVVKESLQRLTTVTLTLCGLIMVALVSGVLIFFYRRNEKFRQKLQGLTSRGDCEASQDYQDLCRQRMQNKSNEKQEPINVAQTTGTGVHSTSKLVSKLSQSSDGAQASPPSRSSTSSWNEEPVASNMDISTGHIILSYMEDHLKKKDRLDREWEALCAYEADPCSTHAASLPQNAKKNRYPDILPYDHSRVILNDLANNSGSDYINANTITDHDPRNPAYIATQGPLAHTAADFWQMVWEQGSVIIVMLTRLMENGVAMCHRYWPEEGSELYHNYEVHLVSEHIWCDDYLVRSFYLKNLKTSETRTVTQFHFLSWPENGVPPNAKSILEFRRKVNKSYRGRSCPIVTHCSDGTGRTGTYALIDMVLNRMSKGAKEIDIAATLEHIRDQRMGMVKTKAQFEYVLTAVAEEVQAILKALAQN